MLVGPDLPDDWSPYPLPSPSPYRTFKKILSKFCSSDILISFLIFGKIDRSTKIIDRHRSFHLLIFGRECSKFNNVIFIISAEIF